MRFYQNGHLREIGLIYKLISLFFISRLSTVIPREDGIHLFFVDLKNVIEKIV